MNTNNLIVYLPLHASTTDLCGNSWTAYGSPTVENDVLKTNGSDQYLELTNFTPVNELFNSDFTIHFYMTYRDSKTSEGGFFTFGNFGWQCYHSQARFNANCNINGSNRWLEIDSVPLSDFKDAEHHFAIVRKDDTLYFFFDGTLKTTYTVGTFYDTDTTLHIARRSNYRTALDMRDFCIHTEALWTENFTPPTDDELVAAEIELAGFAERSYTFDTPAQIQNAPLLNSATKVWLTADNYPTEDIAGNLWHAYQNPTCSNGALQLSGNYQWLALDGGITLGGNDFTIRGKAYMSSSTANYGRIFEFKVQDDNDWRLELTRYRESDRLQFCLNTVSGEVLANGGSGLNNSGFDFEIDYTHADTTFRVFINGALAITQAAELPRLTFQYPWIGLGKYGGGDGQWIGSIDEFMIVDGIALHTANFIPMSTADFDALKSDFNSSYATGFSIQNQIDNEPLTWRYENVGFASLVLPDATTLNNLPATQSKTSVAFYQTAQSKSFTCDAAKTVWIKFDLYHQGGNAFRIFDTSYSQYGAGIYRSSNTQIQFWCNNKAVLNIDNVLQTNTLQTWLLRMTADKINGAIELWCDGVKCGEFIGNVNNGVDFSNIYLQSDGDKNLFSNVIVSNGELTFDDNLSFGTVNVEKIYDVEFNARHYDENFCIAFTGKPARAKIPDDIFNSSTEFTVEVRIATADTHSNNYFIDRAHIFGNFYGFGSGGGINLALNGGNVQFWQTDAQVGDGVHYYVYTDKFVADGDIHKIIVRSNADSSLDIFVDDVLISHTDNFGASLKTGGYNGLWFASDGDTSDYCSRINLFEVRFWDKALADEELFSDIDGTEQNLRAWYLPTPEGLMDFSANMFHPKNAGTCFARWQRILNDMELEILAAKIFFNVRHNGDVIKNPFIAGKSAPAVAIRWLNQNWYNSLISSGDISLRLNGENFYLRGD